MLEKIDKIQELLNVPNVDASTETAIANIKILNLLVDLRAEAKQLISRIEKIEKLNLHNVSKPYYKGKWYYFGKCKPYPVQVDGYPVKPYKQFDTKEECQSYIDSAC